MQIDRQRQLVNKIRDAHTHKLSSSNEPANQNRQPSEPINLPNKKVYFRCFESQNSETNPPINLNRIRILSKMAHIFKRFDPSYLCMFNTNSERP